MNTNFIEKQKSRLTGSVTFKLILIAILSLLLLIPSGMIRRLISERESRRDETIMEVTSKWGNAQTLCGPVLSIPYISYVETDEGVKSVRHLAHFLPDQLVVNGDLNPEIRKRGIYKVIAYNSKLKFNGSFIPADFSEWKVSDPEILWDEAFVSLGISDMRGINNNIKIKWNDNELPVRPGIKSRDIVLSGVTAPTVVKPGENYSFSFDLDLNGSHNLNFIPIGKETDVNLESSWNTPSFDGAYLPTNHNITDTGFTVNWHKLELNRNYPQKWRDEEFNVDDSAFGVNLLFPVDSYQKSTRSVKYAFLFIMLTFLLFFFSEVLSKKRIHAVYYLLTGVALTVFYSLLVALSEHISFNLAYLAASVAIIGLISVFSHSLFRGKTVTITISLVLIALYTFLFTILQLADLSLLLGNIGLFIVLSLVMYFSRKVDWYSAGNADTTEKQ